MSQSAITAALAVAREQGVRCDDPVVLRDAWHVIVHLWPAPVVARVSSSIPFPEGANPDDIARELAVASHAARVGAPVIPPADHVDPGPHRHGGHLVTLWRYISPSEEADPLEAGRGLRTVHDALADYGDPLPGAGHPLDTEAMLASLEPSADVELLREIVRAYAPSDGQALHGDAHLWNCLGSPSGSLWHDFETACRGPREYDLAALVSRDRIWGDDGDSTRAFTAYGPHDADLLEAMLPLYVAWVTASMLVALPRRPELQESIEVRLRWLRER
jgi:hypothetical protein